MNTPDSKVSVKVRRRWNDVGAAHVLLEHLWDFHFRDEAGGVCGAFPRAFLSAHVWCDALEAGALGHRCRGDDPPPHDMLVCILANDNSAEIYQEVCAAAKRR
jgi:hypothetical protein